MSEAPTPFLSPWTGPSHCEQIAAFEEAIRAFGNARTELVSIGSVVAMQAGPPTEEQRERLKELTAEHFMQGETIKAISMTLLSSGILSRCSKLIQIHGEGLH